MNIYWYSPYPHLGEGRQANAVLGADDHLTVHCLRSYLGEDLVSDLPAAITRRDLPEATPGLSPGTIRWFLDRLAVYWRRSRLREQAVRAGSYDLCHIRALNHFTDWWALRSLAQRIPLVSTVQDIIPHDLHLPGRLEHALLELTYRHSGHLVVAHETLRFRLDNEFGVSPDRVSVIPLPIADVGAVTSDRPNPPEVLFFGTFRANKGIEDLLQAVDFLNGVTARFRIAGRGDPALETLARSAAERNPRLEVEIGYISAERKDELYRDASLVVLPYSSFASQSGVLHDAYAYRVPVVATDVGALGISVEEDDTGWVVPSGAPSLLAEAIVDALEDDGRRGLIRQRLDQLARERSDLEVGGSLRSLYEKVVG